MFNAPMRTDSGRISAFYILDLLQSDALYFRENQLVLEGNRHRILGMQFNSEKIDQLKEATSDLAAFARDVQKWMYFCQEKSEIFVPQDELDAQAQLLLHGEPLTAVTLMNLLCANKIKISRHDNICLASADASVKNAFPSLGKHLRRVLQCASVYDGSREEISVIFATSETKDAKHLPARRAVVYAAANMQDAFDARTLKARGAFAEELTQEQIQQFIDDFVRRGIFLQRSNGTYVFNYDSREASILYAEHNAAQQADQQYDVIRTVVTKQATVRYARVKKAVEKCAAAISFHDEEAEKAQEELTKMQEALEEQQYVYNRKKSGFATFCTILLFILFAGCAALGTYQLLFMLQPERTFVSILSFVSVSVKFGICACYAGALFFLLWAILRLVSRKNTGKRCDRLSTRCAQLEADLAEHTSKATQARDESAIYASYLVLTRTIAKDMQEGDCKGLDLARRLVPAQVCMMQDEKAFTVHAQIIIALRHCGTCTQNELAFLSGAGHERIRRALYDMIAAGQIALFREDDVQKFCLCQGL